MIGIKSGNGLQSVDRHLNLMVMTFQEIRGDALIHEPIFREQNAHRRRSQGVFIRSTPPKKKKTFSLPIENGRRHDDQRY